MDARPADVIVEELKRVTAARCASMSRLTGALIDEAGALATDLLRLAAELPNPVAIHAALVAGQAALAVGADITRATGRFRAAFERLGADATPPGAT